EGQRAVRQASAVLDGVERNEAEKVDVDNTVHEGAIPGMVRMLEPESNFFDARQWALKREELRGKYYGVGMGVIPRAGRTVVMAPYVGTPAYKAGIRPGDVIVRIDDKSVEGMGTPAVADLLR